MLVYESIDALSLGGETVNNNKTVGFIYIAILENKWRGYDAYGVLF